MSKSMLICDTPKNCAKCNFKENDYGSPPSCKAMVFTRENKNRWEEKENIEDYVRNETKSPFCPLKPVLLTKGG